MREIKFRAWDQEQRVMHAHVQDWYDQMTEEDGEPYQTENSFGHVVSTRRYNVMQFTGLRDKNGREIYEGDIVASYERQRLPGRRRGKVVRKQFVIRYDAPQFMLGIDEDSAQYLTSGEARAYEVIGNIYENPELLSESEAA
jgi:uncharacterized phage protein (TIGR01671 family)